MKRNRLMFAGLVVLCVQAMGCTDHVGACTDANQGRTRVLVNGVTMYAGQAIVNAACATGCHSSSATGISRQGAPEGLNFNLLPVGEDEAAGTRKNTQGEVVVKLSNAQVDGLRARQKKIVEERDAMWTQLEDKLMPPSGVFETLLSGIFTIKADDECAKNKAYSKLAAGEARESVRNWLACGAPLVESNGTVVEKSRTVGTVGYQYPTCEGTSEPGAVITLESLTETTLSMCKSCHPALSSPNLRTVDDFAASIADGKEPACGGKPYVTPGDPDNSYLLDILTKENPECDHGRMPSGGPYLSASDLQSVSDWIKAGAPTTDADVDDEKATDDASSDDGASDDAT